jgi:proteasome-associated ATPase
VVARDDNGRASRHEDEVSSLTAQISFLDEEIAVLRRRLADSPRQVRLLEERLRETEASLTSVSGQNERLASTLREARDQIVALKEEVDRLAQPPSGFGIFLAACDDNTADVFTGGRKMRVNVSPNIDLDELKPGQEVVLNEALNVVIAQGYETVGEIVMLKELLADGERALVISHADEERVVRLANPLLDSVLRSGDSLLLEPRSGYVYERIPKAEVEELILEEVPDIAYTDIGGLMSQIEQIRDAIELPYLHADLYKEHQLRPPKGVLLYGPPGCGKTLIAKAVANSLAKQVARKAEADAAAGIEGAKKPAEGKSFFLNIKGPELLNKYVG